MNGPDGYVRLPILTQPEATELHRVLDDQCRQIGYRTARWGLLNSLRTAVAEALADAQRAGAMVEDA